MAGVDYVTAGQETTPSAPFARRGARLSIMETRAQEMSFNAQLESERASWMKPWRDIADYLAPDRARFFVADTNQGGSRTSKIRDSHGLYARRTLSAGMNSGMTSAARPWFEVASPDDDKNKRPAVRAWCENVTQRLRNQLLRTNFYQVLPSVYDDVGCFATGVVAQVEDDLEIMRFYSFPVGSYCLSANDRGAIDGFTRRLRYTPQQLVAKFGEANVSQTALTAYRAGQRVAIEVLWVVRPNPSYDPSRLLARFKRYSSCWWEMSSNEGKALRISGFDRFPIKAARWHVAGEDVYGTDSPGRIALPDVKELQEVTRKTSRAIEKMVDPALLAPASAQNQRISLMSGDINVVPARGDEAGFRALHEVRFDVEHASQKINDLRQQIDRGFFVDLFLMLSQDEGDGHKTAREIAERHEEKLTALGPVLNQINNDFLKPVIEGEFELMLRYGAIPPPPPEIAGDDLKIEFVSVLAQAQKLVDIAGIERGWNFTAGVAAIAPDAADVIKVDAMLREYYERLGIDSTLVHTDDELHAIRSQRAQQQQAQMQAEIQSKQAQAAKNLASADTSKQNALTDILGGPVPGQAIPVPA